ncbi:AI-2E family transporter [Paractinoplanes abujensis]|nr:AI-2E family transporter [Actinoplanes abujensis]
MWAGSFIIVLTGLYLAGRLAVRLAPLALALAATAFLAALLHPLYRWQRRLHLPGALAALITVFVPIAALTVPVLLAWQRGAAQLDDLTAQLTRGLQRLRDLIIGPGALLSERQVDTVTNEALIRLRQLLPSPVASARLTLEVLAALLLVLVLLFFVLKDGPGMWRWTVTHTGSRRDTVAEAGAAAWTTLSSYARGTAVIALIDATGIGLALVLLGVPLPIPLALITFFGAFVPILGATVTGAFAVLVALAARGPGIALLTLAAVIVVQQVEGNLLQPLIMRHQIHLHPVVILIAVTAGTLAAGVAGAFVAVPLTAVAYQGITVAHRHTRNERAEPAPQEPATG